MWLILEQEPRALDILISMAPNPRRHIADWLSSRTWTLEVAQGIGMPGIRFNVHGFDISDDQFPSGNILPSNCQLSLGDAVVAPPEALRGTFDIVHVSQFACVRPLHEDPGATIEHAMALLSEFSLRSMEKCGETRHGSAD